MRTGGKYQKGVQMDENVAQGLLFSGKQKDIVYRRSQLTFYCVPEKVVMAKTDLLLQTLVGQRFPVALLSSKN
jgi:hypothetical protein